MTSIVTKLVLRKLFKENKDNKQGIEDPYFETVPATRLGFKSTKKLPKAHPPGLTEKESQVLTKAKRRAYRLDLSLGSFFGVRVGWSAVIGLIPAIGDVFDMLLCLMVYRTICSVGDLPSNLKMRMQFNIVVDFLIGIIPFVGDIADAAYKCNTKNVILFEDELRRRGKKRLKGTAQENMPDPSLGDTFDYQAEEEARTRNGGAPPRYTSRRDRRRNESFDDLESQTQGTVYSDPNAPLPPQAARTNDRRDRRGR
ncbi:uncharacterized protein AB675_1033 [Cyphellophora attinorum]|uniref:Putative membrane protein n=1 Tax=Cyphellophora attinorum TaxID=1664694 RepID=A0A0N1NXR9_9EURO|nr:uncharacterized protein AB675_1033 [Phialophora attinorum]KPI38102.1 putative membrane protein [Phialophora attinorum]